jgi:DivIVA domain-containing protein
MLTAQAIKDQEFQVKFRGYDTIEVKAYLELLAEDFFELGEQSRVQGEEIESLLAAQEMLLQEKEGLVGELELNQQRDAGLQEEIDQSQQEKDRELAELKELLETVQATLALLEQENREYLEKISELEARLVGAAGAAPQEQLEIAKMQARLELLEEQNRELKEQGADFKTTILAAQKFADNLRQTSEEEARKMLDDARAEVEKFRREAEAELARLPEEINRLRRKRLTVKEELKVVLTSYLDSLTEVGDEGNQGEREPFVEGVEEADQAEGAVDDARGTT